MRKKGAPEGTIHGIVTPRGKSGRPKNKFKMYRLQVYIRPELKKWLEAVSAATGIPEVTVIDAILGVHSVKLMSETALLVQERQKNNASQLDKFI